LPFKVISGLTKVAEFGTNRKRVFDFLLVINSNLCRISHRFRDTAAYWSKIANSYTPPSNFGMNVITPETIMMGLPYGEEIMIVGRTMWTQSTSVTDRRTDGQTDGRTELRSQRPCNAERRTVKIGKALEHLQPLPRWKKKKFVYFGPQTTKLIPLINLHPIGLFSGDYISALRGCCALKFLHVLEIHQGLLAHTPSPKWGGDPLKNFNHESLKFGLKFSLLESLTSGLVGLSSRNFFSRRAAKQGFSSSSPPSPQKALQWTLSPRL